MTYKEFIESIILTRGQWTIDNSKYWEGHHIIPRCLGGKGKTKSKHNNIIWLYADEHYIAHKLLALENPNNDKLVYSFWWMSTKSDANGNIYKVSAEDYSIARELFSKIDRTESIDKIKNTFKERKLHCYNNGQYCKYFGEDETIPDGFVRGRILVNTTLDQWRENVKKSSHKVRQPRTDKTKQKLREAHLGEKSFTNGKIEIRLKDSDLIPEGFYLGQLKTELRKNAYKRMKAASLAAQRAMPEDKRKYLYGRHKIGTIPATAIKVFCITTNEVFNSIKKASNVLNISVWLIKKSYTKHTQVKNMDGKLLEFKIAAN